MPTRKARLTALENQIARLNRHLSHLRQRSGQLSNIRLALFLGTLAGIIIVLQWAGELAGWLVFSVGVITFAVIAFIHRKIDNSIRKHEIYLNLKKTQRARMTLSWDQIPEAKIKMNLDEHPFELDLDVTGPFSLHRLLDTAISQEGSQVLSGWLLNKAPERGKLVTRQQLVRELIPLSRFRHRLQLAFSLKAKEPFHGEKFLLWLKTDIPLKSLRWLLPVMGILALTNVVLFSLNQMGQLPAVWVLPAFVYLSLYFLNQKPIEHLLEESVFMDDELTKFRAVLRFLENYPYPRDAELAKLTAPFWQSAQRPSIQLKNVRRTVTLIGFRMNPVMGFLLNAVTPWDFFCARRLEKCRRDLSQILPKWLNLFSQLEGLISLANFGYLNPHYSFPEFVSGRDQPSWIFESTQLGHPLIPEGQKICNDFTLQQAGSIALITGSNMSGKSTFLKTIGANLCLAFAGAPVNARVLRTSLFRTFACIQVNDSVTEGFSFFYAEVRRLKKLLEELQQTDECPVLYLIDEIFKGTNNRERLIGSRSYIRALASQKGLGVISTHDLELVLLADKIPSLQNYHFREEVLNGKMVFDYRLRPGPCPTTNALKIMQLEGLPVEFDP